MKPVLETVVRSKPGRLEAVGRREQDADARSRRARPERGSRRSGRQANGASTTVEIAKRMARNANSG